MSKDVCAYAKGISEIGSVCTESVLVQFGVINQESQWILNGLTFTDY